MKPLLAPMLLSLMLVATLPVSAADNGGGGPGGSGGGFWCRLMCTLKHGSCTIPSGDPDIPPLRDPFCEERKAACRAACGGDSGGGLIIGAQDAPMSPLPGSRCDEADRLIAAL